MSALTAVQAATAATTAEIYNMNISLGILYCPGGGRENHYNFLFEDVWPIGNKKCPIISWKVFIEIHMS